MRATILPETRIFFLATALIVAPLGLLLYFVPGRAEAYWAWSIGQPRTAVLIGSIYIAAMLYYLMLARQHDWAVARISMDGLFFFSVWLLAAAMIHWDSFQPYRLLTLAWLLVYYLAPLLIPILNRLQTERIGPVSTDGIAIAPAWRAWLLGRGAAYVLLALGMFIWAPAISRLWPWPIEPVNVRMFTGQIAAFGVGGARVFGRPGSRWRELRLTMFFTTLLALVQLIGLVVNRGPYDWSAPAGVLLPLMFGEWLVTSVGMAWAHRQPTPANPLGEPAAV